MTLSDFGDDYDQAKEEAKKDLEGKTWLFSGGNLVNFGNLT